MKLPHDTDPALITIVGLGEPKKVANGLYDYAQEKMKSRRYVDAENAINLARENLSNRVFKGRGFKSLFYHSLEESDSVDIDQANMLVDPKYRSAALERYRALGGETGSAKNERTIRYDIRERAGVGPDAGNTEICVDYAITSMLDHDLQGAQDALRKAGMTMNTFFMNEGYRVRILQRFSGISYGTMSRTGVNSYLSFMESIGIIRGDDAAKDKMRRNVLILAAKDFSDSGDKISHAAVLDAARKRGINLSGSQQATVQKSDPSGAGKKGPIEPKTIRDKKVATDPIDDLSPEGDERMPSEAEAESESEKLNRRIEKIIWRDGIDLEKRLSNPKKGYDISLRRLIDNDAYRNRGIYWDEASGQPVISGRQKELEKKLKIEKEELEKGKGK
jgi:hypothetical protein